MYITLLIIANKSLWFCGRSFLPPDSLELSAYLPRSFAKRSFILQAVWQSFHYLVVMSWKMFQVSFSHASFRLAQNGKSFGWDWKIVWLRTFYRFPQWKKAERYTFYLSSRNMLYDSLLSYNLKDETSFWEIPGGTQFRGVKARAFFLFRLIKIYA